MSSLSTYHCSIITSKLRVCIDRPTIRKQGWLTIAEDKLYMHMLKKSSVGCIVVPLATPTAAIKLPNALSTNPHE